MEGQKLPVAAKKGMFWINNNSISTWWEILKQTYSDIHRILLKTIKNIKNFQNRQRNLSFWKVYILLPRTKLRLLSRWDTLFNIINFHLLLYTLFINFSFRLRFIWPNYYLWHKIQNKIPSISLDKPNTKCYFCNQKKKYENSFFMNYIYLFEINIFGWSLFDT